MRRTRRTLLPLTSPGPRSPALAPLTSPGLLPLLTSPLSLYMHGRYAVEAEHLDEADCRLDGAALHARVRKRVLYKEYAFALLRQKGVGVADGSGRGSPLLRMAHACFVVAARHCGGWREMYARWVYALIDGGERALGDAVADVARQRAAPGLTQRPHSHCTPHSAPPHSALVLTASCALYVICLLYTSPSPRDLSTSRMPSSA